MAVGKTSSRTAPAIAQRSTQRDVRRHNRSVVVSTLYFGGPVSRMELTELTGLSTGAMTGLVGELVGEGVLEEAGSVSSDGGRPRTLVRVGAERKLVMGVDIGEDSLHLGLFTLDLRELGRQDVYLAEDELIPEFVVGKVHKAARDLLAEQGVGWDRVLGVGVGMLGIVERSESSIVHAPTVGWDAVPIEELLRPGLGAPVFIDNGARTLGLAEMWFGSGRGASSCAVILYGTGVGAAYVTQPGAPVDLGFATEWGHTQLVYDGRPCRCGSAGCLEAYIGASMLVEQYREIAPDRVPLEENLEASFARLMADAESDESAFRITVGAARRLGASLGGMMNALRPQRILLGGYAGSSFGKRLLPIVREAAGRTALKPLAKDLDIELCRFGRQGVMAGAAALPVSAWLSQGAPAELGS